MQRSPSPALPRTNLGCKPGPRLVKHSTAFGLLPAVRLGLIFQNCQENSLVGIKRARILPVSCRRRLHPAALYRSPLPLCLAEAFCANTAVFTSDAPGLTPLQQRNLGTARMLQRLQCSRPHVLGKTSQKCSCGLKHPSPVVARQKAPLQYSWLKHAGIHLQRALHVGTHPSACKHCSSLDEVWAAHPKASSCLFGVSCFAARSFGASTRLKKNIEAVRHSSASHLFPAAAIFLLIPALPAFKEQQEQRG